MRRMLVPLTLNVSRGEQNVPVCLILFPTPELFFWWGGQVLGIELRALYLLGTALPLCYIPRSAPGFLRLLDCITGLLHSVSSLSCPPQQPHYALQHPLEILSLKACYWKPLLLQQVKLQYKKRDLVLDGEAHL